MNPLKIGWIDYSNEHRNKVMAILDALSAPDALDELGIGQIRDGFADILFPGTSTIQTRAKYFFIVPYLIMELEKVNLPTPKRFLDKLYESELDLIDVLNKEGVSGVIGARAGRKLKTKPSNIYWNGLRTYEFFKYPTLTLVNYAKAFINMKKSKSAVAAFNYEEQDDPGMMTGEYSGTFWQCILPEPNWKENLSIELNADEAAYLKSRMMQAEKSKNSLLALLLKQDPEEFKKITEFDAIGELFTLPNGLKEDYKKAKSFNKFIVGANIRYNIILSNRKNEKAMEEWEEWKNSPFVQQQFAVFPIMEIIERLKIRNPRLVRFLHDWQQVVLANDEEAMDKLIIKREIELKSRERAKLNNTKVYSYQEGDWVGIKNLTYRFPNTKILITDIFKGLEGHHHA